MIPNLFKVATEFRFEIGHAVLGTKTLTDSVDKLSNSVDNAIINFQRLGIGVVANLGMGGGGLLGIITKSVSAFEDFRNAQLTFVNSISANREKLIGPIDTFNEKLLVSGIILKDIGKVAREFALPEKELVNMTKLLAPMLIPEGLAGANFKGAIDLSRKFLKAAPSFGIAPEESTFQLQSAVGGRALQSQTFFQRLTVETKAMREFAGQTEKFNKLAPDKRFRLVNEALDQFSKDVDVLTGRTELISAQFERIKNVFVGVNGALLPLGELLNKLGVNFLKQIESAIHIHGRTVIDNFTKFIKPMSGSIEDLIVLALQLKRISSDLHKSAKTFGVLGIISIIGGFGTLLKIFPYLSKLLKPVIGGIFFLGSNIFRLGFILRILGFVVTKLFFPLTIILGMFQLFSRAAAIAKIKDLKALPEILAKFSELVLRAKNAIGKIIYPFAKAFDWLTDKLSILFRKTIFLQAGLWILEQFIVVLEDIADLFVRLYSIFGGLGSLIVFLIENFTNLMQIVPQMIDRLTSLDFTGAGNLLSSWGKEFGEGVRESFMFGFEETWKDFDKKFAGENAPVVSNVQHFHGGIKIENKFKENQEPDRIAFTLIEQLSKADRNKTQARGASLMPSMAGGI